MSFSALREGSKEVGEEEEEERERRGLESLVIGEGTKVPFSREA